MMIKRRIGFYGIGLLIVGFVVIYNLFTYHGASEAALLIWQENVHNITVDKGGYSLTNELATVNIIICPENQVEAKAYIGWADYYSQLGYSVAVVEYPFHNVFLGGHTYKDYLTGGFNLVIGHGQGSVWVGKFIDDKVDAFISLGGFINKDLSSSDLPTLAILGGQDKIFTSSMYYQKQSYFSKNNEAYILQYGNHSYFGDYGLTKGDGVGISYDEQFLLTRQLIDEWLKEVLIK